MHTPPPPTPSPAHTYKLTDRNPNDNMDSCRPTTPYRPLSLISQYGGRSTFCILILFPITVSRSMHLHLLTRSSQHVGEKEMSDRSDPAGTKRSTPGSGQPRAAVRGSKPFSRDASDPLTGPFDRFQLLSLTGLLRRRAADKVIKCETAKDEM